MKTSSLGNLPSRRQALQTLALPAATAALSPWSALAQTGVLPLEQVKFICGFPAGGTADINCRRIGEKITGSIYSRNGAMVDNKTGAGGR